MSDAIISKKYEISTNSADGALGALTNPIVITNFNLKMVN